MIVVSMFPQTTPTSEEIGYCDEVKVSEIGGTSVTVFKQGTVERSNIFSYINPLNADIG